MSGGFVSWLKTVVRYGNSDNDHENAPSSSGRETNGDAALYACPDCETTYVAAEMASCPECGQSVEAVPNERELGFT